MYPRFIKYNSILYYEKSFSSSKGVDKCLQIRLSLFGFKWSQAILKDPNQKKKKPGSMAESPSGIFGRRV